MLRKTLLPLLVVLSLLAASCSSSEPDSGVASLENEETAQEQAVAEQQPSDEGSQVAESGDDEQSDEEALLAFTICLREEGLDIDDPTVDGAGNLQPPRLKDIQNVDREVAEAAFEACRDLLSDVTFGLTADDLTEMQDSFLEFSVCMRENGYDIPDPDFSAFGPGQGGGGGQGGGVFGGAIDQNDPVFQSAFEACQDVFADALRLPGIGGGTGRGAGGVDR